MTHQRYESCVGGPDGNCSRFSHDHGVDPSSETTELEDLRNALSTLVNFAKERPADYPWTPREILNFEAAVREEAYHEGVAAEKRRNSL